MIDLELLEKMLDDALANETKESLNKWLETERTLDEEALFSKLLVDIESKNNLISVSKNKIKYSAECEKVSAGENNYELAA